ncbi:MAG: hypothetical protein SFY32_11545 [Bacteroidota bacterium]|nr:hypothetical protein [Bacteroidota bacterium]
MVKIISNKISACKFPSTKRKVGVGALFIIILFSINLYASDIEARDLRLKFYQSVDNEKIAKSYLKELSSKSNSGNPLVKGYKAAVCMLMAKHVFNPYSKIKYFIDGKNELEQSISLSPDNVELILIRFAIQTNAPTFLGYYSNINSDKQFLIAKLKDQANANVDTDLRKIMIQYLKQSGKCSNDEIKFLHLL